MISKWGGGRVVFAACEPSAASGSATLTPYLEKKPWVVGAAKDRTASCGFDSSRFRPISLHFVGLARFDTNLFNKQKSKADI